MEASALRAPAGLGRAHISVGTPLLRLRSDEQLVALFRAGHEDAFRMIHDRYRQRLFAYTRQMLPSRPDAEDALQDVFVRAYSGLRANDRQLALRAWLYRVAHNRCIDELRRPLCSPPEVLELVSSPINDPLEEAERRESLRRLVADVRRLPDQQRSALLMRELSGMSYSELSRVLGVSVAAVKSLLVRARIGLVQSAQARETACDEIRDELTLAHDRGVRPNATARRHLRDCTACRSFRIEIRGTSRQLAALAPALGPLGVAAKLLGIGAGGSGAVASGTGGAVAGGTVGATHVATILAAAMVTAGGAMEIDRTLSAATPHHARHHRVAGASSAPAPRPLTGSGARATAPAGQTPAPPSAPAKRASGAHNAASPPPVGARAQSSPPLTGDSPTGFDNSGGTAPGTAGSSATGTQTPGSSSGGVSSTTGSTGSTSSLTGGSGSSGGAVPAHSGQPSSGYVGPPPQGTPGSGSI